MLATIIAMNTLLAFANEPSGLVSLDDNVTPKLVRVTANPDFCKVGSKLSIVEIAPKKPEFINFIVHEVTCIAKYNRDTHQLVNLPPENYQPEQIHEIFTGLPGNLLLRGQYPRKIDGGLGFNFNVTAERPGIYMISSKWTAVIGGREITCAPVIVTVVPLSDRLGRPILRPEWFRSPFDME